MLALVPDGQKEPWGQMAGFMLPSVQTLPAGQVTQLSKPVRFAKLPPGHGSGSVVPSGHWCPSGQMSPTIPSTGRSVALLDEQKNPASHGPETSVRFSSAQNEPPSQAVHCDTFAKLPLPPRS